MALVPITVANLRGGRNGIDSILDPSVPPNQCAEALNIDFSQGACGARRGGAVSISLVGGTAFTTALAALSRFVPTGDETAAELWGVDSDFHVKRMAGGTAWANVILDDAITARPQDISFATLNGKHFMAYHAGATDRMHCYDPNLPAPKVRRVGIAPGLVAPTVANTGAGSYAAVNRYYRVRFINIQSGKVISRSEPTPVSTVFAPSGSGSAARVTRPTAPGESETHWEIDASADNANWNQLVSFAIGNHIAIGTTIYDDSATVSGYVNNDIAEEIGFYTLLPAAQFITSDGNRLIMAGEYQNTSTSRVWFTQVLGSSDQGDDERLVSNDRLKTFVDLNEKDGGRITGLSAPMSGIIFAFKYRRIWRLAPTGDSNVPYQPRSYSSTVGCIDNSGIVIAEDEYGRDALYFPSAEGFYRIGLNGLQYMSRDIEDVWRGLNGQAAVNLNAATKVCQGVYYPHLKQIWWWVATGTSDTPNLKLVLDIRQATRSDAFGMRGGWAIHNGPSAAAYCSTLFANTPGASMSKDLGPYAGIAGPALYHCDSGSDDAGTGFQAYVTTRSLIPADGVGASLYTVGESVITATALAGAIIRQTLLRDFGAGSQDSEVDLSPIVAESHVLRKFGGSMSSDIGVVQAQIGDNAAISQTPWSIDCLMVPLSKDGDL